jgi:uncharacterized protein YdeI (YjbR/CyaY-like superfamily)
MTNPLLDSHFDKPGPWAEGMRALRKIALAQGLVEERKWWQPVYCHDGANVAIIGAFKDYFALSFFKGVLLDDPKGLLAAPGENSQSARLVRLTSADDVARLAADLQGFLAAAVALEVAGAKVDRPLSRNLVLADELVTAFARVPGLETAFAALTPGRQRAYNLHFTGAKQSATRAARVAKYIPDILAGRGWNER